MSFENLKLEDLGLTFMDIAGLNGQDVSTVDANDVGLQFGPSKQQSKSFENWDGCDGKFFFPYSKKDKIGKISDFVTAAMTAVREQERELDRNELIRRKEAELVATGQKVPEKKKEKKKEEVKGFEEVAGEDDDDMGFQTVEDKASRIKRDQKQNKAQQWKNKQAATATTQPTQPRPGQAQNMKAKSKKDQAKQNYYKSNMVKQLRCNLRDNSIDIKPEWVLMKELTK